MKTMKKKKSIGSNSVNKPAPMDIKRESMNNYNTDSLCPTSRLAGAFLVKRQR
jgi:hypothetical protein